MLISIFMHFSWKEYGVQVLKFSLIFPPSFFVLPFWNSTNCTVCSGYCAASPMRFRHASQVCIWMLYSTEKELFVCSKAKVLKYKMFKRDFYRIWMNCNSCYYSANLEMLRMRSRASSIFCQHKNMKKSFSRCLMYFLFMSYYFVCICVVFAVLHTA